MANANIFPLFKSEVTKQGGNVYTTPSLTHKSFYSPGLHKLFHPDIPDGRTRRTRGHGKDGKHQPYD